jgi:hypothetical protein
VAYDEGFANRVRSAVARKVTAPVEEKRMFGGIALMLGGNMAVVIRGKGWTDGPGRPGRDRQACRRARR